MKRPLFALAFGGLVLLVGTVSGLATLWLGLGTALAGGFGWLLGGTPSGPGGAEAHTGNGPDGGDGGGGGGGK